MGTTADGEEWNGLKEGVRDCWWSGAAAGDTSKGWLWESATAGVGRSCGWRRQRCGRGSYRRMTARGCSREWGNRAVKH